jgi:glutaminyl-peptide cyclotransferase
MAIAVALLAGAVLVAWALSRGDRPGATPASVASARAAAPAVPRASTTRFDGRRAFALLRAQVRDYGWRPAGSRSLRRLALRLRGLLPGGRFESISGHSGLRNIVGTISGREPAILVGAHYDVESVPKGFVGANDGAAGTAAVVYLARAVARAPRPPGARAVRFVLFDGEEERAGCADFLRCGLRGSRSYARRHAKRLGSMVLLDYIAAKEQLSFPREGGSDEALWEKLRSAADAVGVGSLFPAGAGYGEILDDHTPFAARGVPAIDIIDFDYGPRDTLADNLDAVSERSLDAVGEAVYRLVVRLRAER